MIIFNLSVILLGWQESFKNILFFFQNKFVLRHNKLYKITLNALFNNNLLNRFFIANNYKPGINNMASSYFIFIRYFKAL